MLADFLCNANTVSMTSQVSILYRILNDQTALSYLRFVMTKKDFIINLLYFCADEISERNFKKDWFHVNT